MQRDYRKGHAAGASKTCNKAARLIAEQFGFEAPSKRKPSKNLKKAIKKAFKMSNAP